MFKKNKGMMAIMLVLTMLAGGLTGAIAQGGDRGSEAIGIELSPEATSTLASLKNIADYYHVMDYQLDYQLDEMLALGAAHTDELAEQISERLFDGLPFFCPAPSLACSAFTAITPEGDYIQGRNLDIADAQNILIRTRPENGYASLSTASGLLLGYYESMPESMLGRLFLLAAPYFPVDGINEKGLSVSVLLQYATPPINQDTGKTAITTTMAIRLLLDKAANIQEAIDLLSAYDMNGMANANYHFQLADASGASVIIEYVNSELRVLPPEEYGCVVTNYFLSHDAIDEYRDGEDRLITLQAALDENNSTISMQKAMEMLDSVKLIHDYDELSGIDYNTSYSIVFNNSKSTMDVCVNMDYSTTYSFAVDGAF